MPQRPTLYVCHGDTGGPKMHPCRRVQDAMREAGIEYDKVVAAHGNPIPFLRKDLATTSPRPRATRSCPRSSSPMDRSSPIRAPS